MRSKFKKGSQGMKNDTIELHSIPSLWSFVKFMGKLAVFHPPSRSLSRYSHHKPLLSFLLVSGFEN
jgi:hypothetical protein